MKDAQSSLPRKGQNADSSTVYIVAAYCTECRSHLELCLDFRGEEDRLAPCPKKNWPLHHFIYKPEISQNRQMAHSATNPAKENTWVDIQQFQCSSPTCSAKLSIRFKPPRLTADWVSLLTDSRLINQRATRAMTADQELFEGHAAPQPMDVLYVLCQYINNALKGEGRKITASNKKWRLCLGEPCSDLLQYLGFESDVSIQLAQTII